LTEEVVTSDSQDLATPYDADFVAKKKESYLHGVQKHHGRSSDFSQDLLIRQREGDSSRSTFF
jgi:hypothetical protein